MHVGRILLYNVILSRWEGSSRVALYAAITGHTFHTVTYAYFPTMQEQDRGKKTLVLDLDETLVHSSFKPIPNPDYIIPVEIEGKIVDVYVLKRPWLDHFMAAIAGRFEIIIFTASLSKYAGEYPGSSIMAALEHVCSYDSRACSILMPDAACMCSFMRQTAAHLQFENCKDMLVPTT